MIQQKDYLLLKNECLIGVGSSLENLISYEVCIMFQRIGNSHKF